MKKTVFIMLVLAAVMTSCDKEENKNDDVKTGIASTDYMGILTAENIKVSYNSTEKTDSASITLYQVKFSPRMPLTLDVTVPGISVKKTDKGAELTCQRVIPLAMGGEYPNYTVTGLVGKIVDNQLSLSLNFGSTHTSYQGEAIGQ